MREFFARIAGRCVERPAPVLAAVALLALIGAVAALRLEADAGTDQLVDQDSEAAVATDELKQRFGDDAVVVLVEGDLEQLVLTDQLRKLLALEACLSGNAPGGRVFPNQPAPAPCAELAESKPARVVYGPATFLNQFAVQAERLLVDQVQAAQAQARTAYVEAAARARREGLPEAEQRAAGELAAQQVVTQLVQQYLTLGVRYGLTGPPRIDDPRFVSSVVFDSSRPGEPKPKFSYLFPSGESALVSIRLEPDLSEAERREAIDLIRAAVADPDFRLRDASYVVSGVPVVLDGLAETLESEIYLLLAIALVVMAIALALVFGPPLRLLPLAVALVATAIVFGGLAAAGGSLTMASLAVLPILIGLAVDYAIQFQARFGESMRAGSSPARAAVEAAAAGGPVIATALVATAAGFAVLVLSPVPMVRGFGLLLVAGIAIAFAIALTAGLAALSLVRAGRAGPGTAGRAAMVPRAGSLAPAAERIAAARARSAAAIRTVGKRTLATSISAPGRVLVVGLVVAIAGWALATRTEIISDIRELVPASLPELEDVDRLQDATGVSGEVDVTVSAPDVTDPELVAWMGDLKQRVLDRAGFQGEPTSCLEQEARLCPSIALSDIFGSGDEPPSRSRIRGVLGLLPPYFSQAVVSLDEAPATEPSGTGGGALDGGSAFAGSGPYPGTAVIAFGIKVMPFDEQKELIDAIRAEIDPAGTANDPPPGVSAEVAGLSVLAADANAALSDNRYLLTFAGFAAVALVLLLAYRSLRRALVPLVPIAFATGWAALGLAIAGVPLNPMSATLGALVIAIATEFSVLLSARFEEERRGGVAVGEALRRAYARTGAAVLASGVTAIAGFAALTATEIRMLRDFGIVTVIDLGVALVGVLVVLPAALVWAEGGFAPVRGLAARVRQRRAATATRT
jgi:uncharacterized protein